MVVWKCDLKQPTTLPHGSGNFPECTKQLNGEANDQDQQRQVPLPRAEP
jgi:hypothetical protein